MAMTTKPKPGAMADSAQSIMNRAATKERMRSRVEVLKEGLGKPKVRKSQIMTTSPLPPKKPMTTSPLPPKKPATNYIQGKK